MLAPAVIRARQQPRRTPQRPAHPRRAAPPLTATMAAANGAGPAGEFTKILLSEDEMPTKWWAAARAGSPPALARHALCQQGRTPAPRSRGRELRRPARSAAPGARGTRGTRPEQLRGVTWPARGSFPSHVYQAAQHPRSPQRAAPRASAAASRLQCALSPPLSPLPRWEPAARAARGPATLP